MNNNRVTQNTTTVNRFEEAKAAFEKAYSRFVKDGTDCTAELMTLAEAVARSVVNKCIDPQRKTAAQRDTISNNGHSPALVAIRRDIRNDLAALETVARLAEEEAEAVAADSAAAAVHRGAKKALAKAKEEAEAAAKAAIDGKTDKGKTAALKRAKAAEALAAKRAAAAHAEAVRKTEAMTKAMRERLGDGIDLVNEAAAALWELAAEHAGRRGWLDRDYLVRVLSRRVFVSMDTQPEWKERETCAMTEATRAVRRLVSNTAAVHTDPKNSYSYIEDLADDEEGNGLEVIYRRLGKFSDLGGTDSNGNYTADEASARLVDSVVASIGMTATEARALALRLAGCGVEETARRMGVNSRTTRFHLQNIGRKLVAWAKAGETAEAETIISALESAHLDELDTAEAQGKARPVVQYTMDGKEVAAYGSAAAAAFDTGINKGSISAAASGKRESAGGFRWKYMEF